MDILYSLQMIALTTTIRPTESPCNSFQKIQMLLPNWENILMEIKNEILACFQNWFILRQLSFLLCQLVTQILTFKMCCVPDSVSPIINTNTSFIVVPHQLIILGHHISDSGREVVPAASVSSFLTLSGILSLFLLFLLLFLI